MNQINPSIASLLDVFARELQTQLSVGLSGNTSVSRSTGNEDPTPADLIWWSWSLSIDPASRILAGASLETWKTIGGLDDVAAADDLKEEWVARCTPVVEKTARSRFGSEVTCSEAERLETPPSEWTSVSLTITLESGAIASVYLSLSPDLEKALGGPPEDAEISREEDLIPLAKLGMNSADVLMDVEMPVSVSLGRTKMRLKDLLHLTNGSVVELDQELGDEVEIRVNSCVIAYGEVVAVDGNYAVRILKMAPARNTPNLRGTPQERAA